MPQAQEGTVIKNPQTGERRVLRGGQWVPMPPEESGMTPLGQGYVKNEAGGVFKEGARGGLQQVGGTPQISADAAARVGISLDPLIEAQGQLDRAERRVNAKPMRMASGEFNPAPRGNPLSKDWGAVFLDGLDDNQGARFLGIDTGAMARSLGGQDYQDYQQASSTYESAMLPIYSGAAVSPSEAKRLIRADLPQMGDTPETLEKKARNRALRINWAAKQMGQKPPFVVPDSGPPRPVTGFGAGDGSALKDPRPQQERPVKATAPSAYRVLSVE